MTRTLSCVVAGLILCAAVPAADASQITFSFAGSVSQDPLLDPADPFAGAIAAGTLFSGSYTFESTTIDGDASLNGGSYTSAGGTLSLSVGGNPFVATDFLNIGVGNDFGGSDFYTLFAQNTTGADPFDLSLTLQDLDGTIFGSAGLPSVPPTLSRFEVATLFFNGLVSGNQVQIDGQLTSLTCTNGCAATVPEPATLALLGAGSFLVAACRVRRRP
jgi:hypothetical protein